MKRLWIAALLVAGCGGSISPEARDLEGRFQELEKISGQIESELGPLQERYSSAARRNDRAEMEHIDQEAQAVAERLRPLMTKRQGLLTQLLERSSATLRDRAEDADVLDVRVRIIEGYELPAAEMEEESKAAEVLGDLLTQTERLLKLRPSAPSALTSRAHALRKSGRWAEARRLLSTALKADAALAPALAESGIVACCLDEYADAVKSLEAALSKPEALPLSPRREAAEILKTARERQPYWEKEQELRRRDDGAGLPQVKLVTSKGEIVLELFEDDAPNTVANFVSLVETRFYDGTRFHRVVADFMAQGGDPNSRDGAPETHGQGGPGYAIRDEMPEGKFRRHFRGSISMANSGPNTNGSQFFVTRRPTEHLDGRHTVFGRVVAGLDVADSLTAGDLLQQAVVLRRRDHPYRPVTER